ncbi:hypothetical protein C5167_008670 [Papaver somniferum]|uniref:Uncharacterized protein n=1 Tax=Papaver somniferum TaxID=3469 RepID=A0A4Y7JY69_PAPSO|nr:hypothetical protein C5167_008670 [Papaver somniferum]
MASLPLGPNHLPENDEGEGGTVKIVPPHPSKMETEKEISAAVVEGNDQVTGHIISTTIGGKMLGNWRDCGYKEGLAR